MCHYFVKVISTVPDHLESLLARPFQITSLVFIVFYLFCFACAYCTFVFFFDILKNALYITLSAVLSFYFWYLQECSIYNYLFLLYTRIFYLIAIYFWYLQDVLFITIYFLYLQEYTVYNYLFLISTRMFYL